MTELNDDSLDETFSAVILTASEALDQTKRSIIKVEYSIPLYVTVGSFNS